jgi:C1A family cysteine protease
LGACTAHAVSTQIEFLMRSKDKNKSQLSRLFLYKATRRLLGWTGDTGAYIRSTIKAMRVFGAPPEEYYPYNIESFDEEPKAFSYAFADDYRATSYARLDILDSLRSELLDLIKRALADGLPVTFGFTVFASLTDDPYVPMPGEDDKAIGGHAVCAIGYDDDFKVLIFQNSWGLDWGENGFGYLPFAYVEKGLANDFWVVTQTNAENMRLFD